MAALDLVVMEGSELPTGGAAPYDALANTRARNLAHVFEASVGSTAWAKKYLGGDDPIPAEVFEDLSEAACLCRLRDTPAEREAIIELFTTARPEAPPGHVVDARRRHEALAQFLSTVDRNPLAATDVYTWRGVMWDMAMESPTMSSTAQRETAAGWGAFAARELQTAALGVLFEAVCRLGRTERPPEGWSHRSFLAAVASHSGPAPATCGVVVESAQESTASFSARAATVVAGRSLEELAADAVKSRTLLDALVVVLELQRRLPGNDSMPEAWRRVAAVDGGWQEGLHHFHERFRRHLSEEPTVGETLAWLAARYILAPHERVAMSKLPNDTFRFRYNGGELTFFGTPRTHLGDGSLRHHPLSLLTRDLGLWHSGPDGAVVSDRGRKLVAAAWAQQP
jgi:hypothetical protein